MAKEKYATVRTESNLKSMTAGDAVVIFKDIWNPKWTAIDKRMAIKIVVAMDTHNSIKKDELIQAIRWMYGMKKEG